MKTEKESVQALIDHLEKKLITEQKGCHKFTKVGPRSFSFVNNVDTIFVYVRDDEVVIINDGDHVIDGIVMKRNWRHNPKDPDFEALMDEYVQEILHLF